MKKYLILFLVFVACNQAPQQQQDSKSISNSETQSLIKAPQTDGHIDIAVLGQGYRPNDKELFLSDIENIKAELFIRLWQRKEQFTFIPLSWKNSFQCVESGFFDGGTCNDSKVVAAVNDAGVSCDAILVLVKNLKGGGGGAICMSGAYYHDRLHSGQTGVHELAHTLFFGPVHEGIFMNSGGSFGADAWKATFSPEQFSHINETLNRIAGKIESPAPTIIITNSNVVFKNVNLSAKVTGLVQQIEIIVDSIPKATLMYWGDAERNLYCNPTDGLKYFSGLLSSGQHIFKMIATDINNQKAETIININIP